MFLKLYMPKKALLNILLAVPPALSVSAYILKKGWLFLVAFVVAFAAIGLAPVCARRQTLWTFLIGAGTIGPFALYFCIMLYRFLPSVEDFLLSGLLFSVLFSNGLLLLMILSICFWKNQLDLDDDNLSKD